MNTRDREHATLSFGDVGARGAVEETFYPSGPHGPPVP